MVQAKHVFGKNILWSTLIVKRLGGKIFAFPLCPLEPSVKWQWSNSYWGWILWFMLAGPSKGQCRNSKIPPLHLVIKVDPDVFFSETCFAYTIWCQNSRCDLRWWHLKNPLLSDIYDFQAKSIYIFYLWLGRIKSLIDFFVLWRHFSISWRHQGSGVSPSVGPWGMCPTTFWWFDNIVPHHFLRRDLMCAPLLFHTW